MERAYSAISDRNRSCAKALISKENNANARPDHTLGRSRHFDRAPFTSGLPRLADILRVIQHVAKVARTGLMHRTKIAHSITSSASNCNEFGTSMPRAFAVRRLMTGSNLLGRMTGRSPGFSPLRTRPTTPPLMRAGFGRRDEYIGFAKRMWRACLVSRVPRSTGTPRPRHSCCRRAQIAPEPRARRRAALPKMLL